MTTIRLRVVEMTPDTPHMRPTGDDASIQSNGPNDWACGDCGRVLATKMHGDSGIGAQTDHGGPIIVVCPECEAGNVIQESS